MVMLFKFRPDRSKASSIKPMDVQHKIQTRRVCLRIWTQKLQPTCLLPMYKATWAWSTFKQIYYNWSFAFILAGGGRWQRNYPRDDWIPPFENWCTQHLRAHRPTVLRCLLQAGDRQRICHVHRSRRSFVTTVHACRRSISLPLLWPSRKQGDTNVYCFVYRISGMCRLGLRVRQSELASVHWALYTQRTTNGPRPRQPGTLAPGNPRPLGACRRKSNSHRNS